MTRASEYSRLRKAEQPQIAITRDGSIGAGVDDDGNFILYKGIGTMFTITAEQALALAAWIKETFE